MKVADKVVIVTGGASGITRRWRSASIAKAWLR